MRHLPSQISVRSRTESTRPIVQSSAAAPATVDATTGDRSYTVSARVGDTVSGLAFVGVQIITPWMQEEGVDLGDVDPEPMHLTAGSRHLGTWSTNIPVDSCWIDPGRYVLRIFASDRAGNRRGPAARTSVTVLTSDNQAPHPTSAEPFRAVGTQPVTYKFSEDVVGISGVGAPVLPGGPWLGRASTNLPPAPLPGTWACATNAKQPVDCWAGPVRLATWTPATPLAPGEYGVDFNPEHNLDVSDLAGNPIDQWYIVTWTVS